MITRLLTLVMLSLVLFSTPLEAQAPFFDPQKTRGTLRAEYVRGNGLEQVAIIFEKDKVVMITNSNFLSPSRKAVHLGVFHSKFDEALKVDHKSFGQLKDRVKSEKWVNGNKPHSVKLFIDNIEISQSSFYYESLLERLKEIISTLKWTAKDVARVELNPGKRSAKVKVIGRNAVSKLSDNTVVNCKVLMGNRKACKVNGFGVAHFSN